MTGDEHFAEAERLRECARDSIELESRVYFNAAAQVHATLALVAYFRPERTVPQPGGRPDWIPVSEPR